MLQDRGKKHLRCKSCNNLLVRFGKTTSGKKRYYCADCKTTSLYKKTTHKKERLFELFRQYVLWGLSYEILSNLSGYSVSHLVETFHEFIIRRPPIQSKSAHSTSPGVLLIDGLWFNRWFVLMVYRRSGNLRILRISTGTRELKSHISRDLLMLKVQGYTFTGITTDGGKSILGAIQKVFPSLPHQVCLAHMHRQILNNLGRNPKDPRVLFLRHIADLVWRVETNDLKEAWSTLVDGWRDTHKEYINERRIDDTGRWWYVHKGVRYGLRLMDSIYFHSFIFLRYPHLPKTTNEIEAQFGHLGKRWRAHRGLKTNRWESFMDWFVYFYNEDKDKRPNSKLKGIKKST